MRPFVLNKEHEQALMQRSLVLRTQCEKEVRWLMSLWHRLKLSSKFDVWNFPFGPYIPVVRNTNTKVVVQVGPYDADEAIYFIKKHYNPIYVAAFDDKDFQRRWALRLNR